MIRLTLEEMRRLRGEPLPEEELRRAKDHMKGGLVLSLESSGARMNHLARQEIYFGGSIPLEEILDAIEAVSADDVQARRRADVRGPRSARASSATSRAGGRAEREFVGVSLRFRVLGSGSDGNATLVEGGGARVLLDAGLGPRQLAERLQSAGVDPAALDAVLRLARARRPRARRRRFSREVGRAARRHARAPSSRPAFDRAQKLPALRGVIEPGQTRTFRAAHRASRRRCRTTPRGRSRSWSPTATVSFGHATDLGHLCARSSRRCARCDAMLVESNYDPAMLRDGPYPWSLKERILGPFGHLSNDDVARLLEKGLGAPAGTWCSRTSRARTTTPELARMTAGGGARARRPGDVQLTLAGARRHRLDRGPAARQGRRPGADRQLRLF